MPVHLFLPCYIDQAGPSIAQALTRILDQRGIAWSYPADQTCCGQFAFNAGDLPGARRLLRHFLAVFANSGDEAILCPSASCVLTIRHHYRDLVRTLTESRRWAQVHPRLFEFSEWVSTLPLVSGVMPSPARLVLHQSCASRQLGVIPAVRLLVSTIDNLTLLDVSPYYACCGFGGLFSITQPAISTAIGLAYLHAVQDVGAQGLVSTDFSCLLHLRGLIQAHRLPLQAHHLVEVLAAALSVADGCSQPPEPLVPLSFKDS